MPEERGQQSWPGATGADETVLQNVAGQVGPVEFADFLIAATCWESVVVLSNVFRSVVASFSYRAVAGGAFGHELWRLRRLGVPATKPAAPSSGWLALP